MQNLPLLHSLPVEDAFFGEKLRPCKPDGLSALLARWKRADSLPAIRPPRVRTSLASKDIGKPIPARRSRIARAFSETAIRPDMRGQKRTLVTPTLTSWL